MKRLVIDDEREFEFPADPQGFVVYARTSEEALFLLESGESFDEVWLDWDLGGDDHVGIVLEAIERAAMFGHPFTVGEYVIHTQNSVGRVVLTRSLVRWNLPHRQQYDLKGI